MSEQFMLQWNDFQSNFTDGLPPYLELEEFVDVTLSAEGETIKAHKLILSLCSPYFKNILKFNTCEHPVIIIKDVKIKHLRKILQYMYQGRVNIPYEELSGFLDVGSLLEVKGLTPARSKVGEESKDSLNRKDLEDTSLESMISDVSASTSMILNCQSRDICKEDTANIKQELSPERLKQNKGQENMEIENTPQDISRYKSKSDSEENPRSLLKMNNKKMFSPQSEMKKNKCTHCNRLFVNRYNLKLHIRDKHDVEGGGLVCHICNKVMRNQSCLRVHLYHHKKSAVRAADNSFTSTDNPSAVVEASASHKTEDEKELLSD